MQFYYINIIISLDSDIHKIKSESHVQFSLLY